MAVKKHKTNDEEDKQMNLITLAQYIKIVLDQNAYNIQYMESIKYCCQIVNYLATYPLPTGESNVDDVVQHLHPFIKLFNVVTSKLTPEEKAEFIPRLLEQFYNVISNPDNEVSAVLSIVLRIFGSDEETIATTTMWICEQKDPDSEIKLRTTLDCLYKWLLVWPCTTYAADWTLNFIKCLENTNHYDILVDVTMKHLDRLFGLLNLPKAPVHILSKVILYILSAVREMPETLNKVANQVHFVLKLLAEDTRLWTRQIMQDIVDLITAILAEQVRLRGKDNKAITKFREDYSHVYLCLECHMASTSSQILAVKCWRKTTVTGEIGQKDALIPARKVGMLNLGNTCYLNSVIQVLHITRQFSYHAIMNLYDLPHWSSLAQLFAIMKFSDFGVVNPINFISDIRQMNFGVNQQNDCSEFLSYLLVLLQDAEILNDFEEEIVGAFAGVKRTLSPEAATGEGASGSSEPDLAAGPSNPLKRNLAEAGPSRAVKRVANNQSSFVHSIFGGTIVTTIQCRECQIKSVNRDLFLDLHLAYPEKVNTEQNSVQDMLDYFCSTEELSGANQYSCRVCNQLKDADRSVSIETAPKHLVLVLKNFRYDAKLNNETKLLNKIEYNQTVYLPLDSPHGASVAYKIYAAIVHSGTLLHSGHYYVLAQEDNQWTAYDDDYVRLCGSNVFNNLTPNRTPYILFYRRHDIEEPTDLSLSQIPQQLQECVQANDKEMRKLIKNKD